MSDEDRQAIDERKALIESRARALAEEADGCLASPGYVGSACRRPHRQSVNVGSTAANRRRLPRPLPDHLGPAGSAGERRLTLSAQTAYGRSGKLARRRGSHPAIPAESRAAAVEVEALSTP